MKRYPLSVQKHAHDIEFRRNRVRNIMSDMESGEIAWSGGEYDRLERGHGALTELLLAVLNSRDGRIAYLTGPQIGLAKECVTWASNIRANSLIAAGKTEYLNFC